MKLKVLYAALIVLLIGFWAHYYFKNNNIEIFEPATKTTSILVEKRIRNLGKVRKGIPATSEFKIVNTGDVPLVIYSVDADCKCTVPAWEKSPIKPKESTVVKMTYNAQSIGFFSKKAIIKYNSSDGDCVVLMQGEVL